MLRIVLRATGALAVLAAAVLATRAEAVPTFARKYGTACNTCHTVYPRLTPFGEAFRRNGYRFPGVDSDYVKGDVVALGQDAAKQAFPNAVWPAWMPSVPGLSFGANGSAVFHPSSGADAYALDGNTRFSLDNLLEEGHIFAAGAISDTITIWAELTLTKDGGELENAQILFNDLFGPKHLLNLTVGRGIPTLTAFGPHDSYVSDRYLATSPLLSAYGNDPAFELQGHFNLLELNGILPGGRFEYGVGLHAGSHLSEIRPTENVYGHLAYKLGGMRLDGEGSTGAQDVEHPWAENALTVYAFGQHAKTQFGFPEAGGETLTFEDSSNLVGGGLHGQLGSLELDLGGYWDKHDHVTSALGADGAPGEAVQTVFFGELSYILYPWLVPAVRVEHVIVSPTGGTSNDATRILPGVAFLIRQNVKLAVVGRLERSSGAIEGGEWTGLGFTILPRDPSTGSSLQFSAVNANLAFAF